MQSVKIQYYPYPEELPSTVPLAPYPRLQPGDDKDIHTFTTEKIPNNELIPALIAVKWLLIVSLREMNRDLSYNAVNTFIGGEVIIGAFAEYLEAYGYSITKEYFSDKFVEKWKLTVKLINEPIRCCSKPNCNKIFKPEEYKILFAHCVKCNKIQCIEHMLHTAMVLVNDSYIINLGFDALLCIECDEMKKAFCKQK